MKIYHGWIISFSPIYRTRKIRLLPSIELKIGDPLAKMGERYLEISFGWIMWKSSLSFEEAISGYNCK